ncbi:co-chaperone YbbN [Trebonia kvetii]|uniref:Co-chaperone YbbN n=2 Tax=Trebonia kvetii TaxID=2480626 RepID=A0A6P2C020_9ACTN|nr:co-chaperone YbbN [Trebonia kvetii]
MYGAVDLGARQAAAQRRQQQAARAASASGAADGTPSAGSESAFVFDVTEETFNDDVALRSRTTPVIVDLWADWCGPCKQLSPVLEKLAGEANGAWVLAKIDVDANPRLAQAFQAQSIPMVVAIIGGQMVDAFLGAMPEAQIKQWLAQVLSVADQLGVAPAGAGADSGSGSGDAFDDLPPALSEARDAMETGDLDGAAQALEKALADVPADPLAKSWLAQVNLMRRVSSVEPADAARDAAERPDDVEAQLLLADFEMASGDAEQAFDRVLAVIKRTSGAERNTARLRLLDLFEVLPPDDERLKKARTQLTLLLF